METLGLHSVTLYKSLGLPSLRDEDTWLDLMNLDKSLGRDGHSWVIFIESEQLLAALIERILFG